MSDKPHEPWLIALEKSVAGAFFAALTLSLLLQVVTRMLPRFFGEGAIISLPWTEELARFSFVWLLMLGASVGMYTQEHFALTLITDAVPITVRGWMQGLVYLLELVFVGFLIVYGYRMSELVWGQISPALGVRYTYVYMSVPIGGALMATHIVGSMVKRYSRSR
ncbi:MAG TPA: TRAP transporter small permease [Spirochaetia bacterium]|nr:TRAP transporter small permease [Spirochaetia bacterium]